jgi:hypothetical protein
MISSFVLGSHLIELNNPLFPPHHCWYVVLGELLKPHFYPRVPHNPLLHLHLCHCFVDPCCKVTPCWSAHCAMDDSFGNHPRGLQPSDTALERLIKANMNRLTKGGVSSQDVLYLHPKLVNPLN